MSHYIEKGMLPWLVRRKKERTNWPLCPCGKPAVEVDPIVALAAGGSNTFDNLQALCKPGHSRKTALDTGLGSANPQEGEGGRIPIADPAWTVGQ